MKAIRLLVKEYNNSIDLVALLKTYQVLAISELKTVFTYKCMLQQRKEYFIRLIVDDIIENAVTKGMKSEEIDWARVSTCSGMEERVSESYINKKTKSMLKEGIKDMKVGIKYAIKMGKLFALRSGAITLSEWETWHESSNKVDCVCYFERAGKDDPLLLGNFKMDLDAPANIMRSYIRVNFREILNESIGDAFEFYLPGENGIQQLARTAEAMTYSKDYAPFTLDKNMDGKYIVSIIIEKDYRSAILIPEQTDEILTGKKAKAIISTKSKKKKRKKE
jgi:hypothetical protein